MHIFDAWVAFLCVLLLQTVKLATSTHFENCDSVEVAILPVSMNYLASLLLPAVVGLVAGMGHGVASHVMDLPMSLGDQVVAPLVESDLW